MATDNGASAAFIDLDAALAERNAEPVIIRFGGKEYRLPPTLSAQAMLAAFRLDKDASTGSQAEANMRLIFTDSVFDALVEDGIAWSDLVEITTTLTSYYMGVAKQDAEPDDAEGEDNPSQ